MTRPYLGNPRNTIEVLQKYGFGFPEKVWSKFFDRSSCTGKNHQIF